MPRRLGYICISAMKARLHAGAAAIDLTPPAGTHLGGTWGRLRPGALERIVAASGALLKELYK